MSIRYRVPQALLALMAAGALPASPAAASSTQESVFMDDAEIVYAQPEALDQRMAELAELGVDRVRVSVYWHLLAPGALSRERPAFSAGPADPRSYPEEEWNRYDRIVALARARGMDVLFSITGPAPLWATTPGPNPKTADVWQPSAEDFRAFVTALGTRYSGSYRDEQPGAPPPPRPPPQQGLLPLVPPSARPSESAGGRSGAEASQAPAPEIIPRVTHWSIWNEPNHGGWLGPQSAPVAGGGLVPSSPHQYRRLVAAAWDGLAASSHGSDTVLLGETAPRGFAKKGAERGLRPLEFIRELYCLDRRMRPLRGAAARVRECPVSAAESAQFPLRNPGLFLASGWANHPYALEFAPAQSDPVKDHVTLADTRRLTSTLDRALRRYRRSRKLAVWLTEYGYQTDPPDPTIGVNWREQAAYLNEGDYLAYRNRRVASQAQFLLVDDGPRPDYPARDPRYWGSFQSGLVTRDGRRKPAYEAYKRPFVVAPSRPRRGTKVRAWGQYRPAPPGTRLSAKLQFRRRGRSAWRTLRRLATSNSRGFLDTRVRATGDGSYRLVWTEPGSGRDLETRPVAVRMKKPRSKRRRDT